MLTRLFNMLGLAARIAELKAALLVFAVKRSVIAVVGYFAAAVVALAGLGVLLAAGYVALAAIIGVPLALAAVGVFLLLMAAVIGIIAKGRGKGTDQALTEAEAERHAAQDVEELRSMLGLNNDESKPKPSTGPPMPSSPQFNSVNGLDNPKVVMAAGVALLGLLGPGRIFKTIRMATALASIAAVANRAVNEHQEKEATQRTP